MKYAQVAVDSPRCHQPLSYSLPEQIAAEAGCGVWVPFGTQTLCGLILEVSDYPSFEPVRDIIALSHPQPLLTQEQIALGCWLSRYYYSSLFSALSLLLPPGWQRPPISYLEARGGGESEEEQRLLLWLRETGRVRQVVVERRLGKRRSRELLPRWLSQGRLAQSFEAEKTKIGPRQVAMVRLQIDGGRARDMAKENPIYALLLNRLAEAGALPLSQVKGLASASRLRSLQAQGIIAKEKQEAKPSYAPPPPLPSLPPLSQKRLLAEVEESLNQIAGGQKPQKQIFLLLGENREPFYHRLLFQAIASGQRCLVLSPEGESALHRSCAETFPGRCLSFHGKLSPRQKFDAWQAIQDGAGDIVLGSRSALFAPLIPLGLIIVDEEQERSYKEENMPPYYHAREVAIKMAELRGAVVVLGSATPDVESYYRCQQGEISLIELPQEEGGGVEVVSMRQELRQGQRSPLSRALTRGLAQTLSGGGQALLFINRRGLATSVHCEICGEVLRCPRCELPLTYHRGEKGLLCHHCGYEEPLPRQCPQCQEGRLRLWGVGTERVEEEVHHLFPQARVGRWEERVSGEKRDRLLAPWVNRQLDIFIGTQALVQGPSQPQADLVGIVAGDMSLSFPDFRCAERTFQLLAKLLELRRPGGVAIIQAYLSEHYAIQAAARQDYLAFYQAEIQHRQRYGYPPFTRLARLLVSQANARRGEQLAQRLAADLEEEREAKGLALRILGPAPAFHPLIKGRFRWQILLLGEGLEQLLAPVLIPPGVRVELDPVEL